MVLCSFQGACRSPSSLFILPHLPRLVNCFFLSFVNFFPRLLLPASLEAFFALSLNGEAYFTISLHPFQSSFFPLFPVSFVFIFISPPYPLRFVRVYAYFLFLYRISCRMLSHPMLQMCLHPPAAWPNMIQKRARCGPVASFLYSQFTFCSRGRASGSSSGYPRATAYSGQKPSGICSFSSVSAAAG